MSKIKEYCRHCKGTHKIKKEIITTKGIGRYSLLIIDVECKRCKKK